MPDLGVLPLAAGPVLLRRLHVADLPAFQAYRSDAELARYQGWQPMSDEVARAFLLEMNATPLLANGAWCQLGIADTDDAASQLVGDIGLRMDDDGQGCEVGITLARAAHGQGWATAALRAAIAMVFARTQARHVIGISDARNAPSLALLQRAGMQHVATQDAMFKGEACIEHTYRIARPTSGARG